MKLPFEKRKPRLVNSEVLVLYGLPKVGKTEVVNALNNFLIIDLEEGTVHTESLSIDIESLDDLQKLGEQIMIHKRETGEFPYDGIVIDTATKLDEWCEWEATESYMNSPMGQTYNTKAGVRLPRSEWKSALVLPRGAGYHWHRESFKKWFYKINKLAKYKIYICHVKDRFLEKDDIEVVESDLDLTGKLKTILTSRGRAIGYLYRNSDNPDELRVSFKGTGALGGSSVAHLKNQDFVLAENDPETGEVVVSNWDKIYVNEEFTKFNK